LTRTAAASVRGCLVTTSSNSGNRSGSRAGVRCIRWIRGCCAARLLGTAVVTATGIVLAHLEGLWDCSAHL